MEPQGQFQWVIDIGEGPALLSLRNGVLVWSVGHTLDLTCLLPPQVSHFDTQILVMWAFAQPLLSSHLLYTYCVSVHPNGSAAHDGHDSLPTGGCLCT